MSNEEVTGKLYEEIFDLNTRRSCGNRVIRHSRVAASQDNIALTANWCGSLRNFRHGQRKAPFNSFGPGSVSAMGSLETSGLPSTYGVKTGPVTVMNAA